MNLLRPSPPEQVRAVAVALAGGLDTETSLQSLPPGSVIASENYEPSPLGGYRKMLGYERLDGRPKPSEALVLILGSPTGFTGAVVAGAILSGATSLATGTVAYVSAGSGSATRVALTKTTGEFTPGENLLVTAAVVGTATVEPGVSQSQFNAMMGAAAGIYRADIAAVPGSGPVRGVCILGADIYALRDNVGATAQDVYKATAGGWTVITARKRIKYNAGTGYPPTGTVIEQWNGAVLVATGVVNRLMDESGDLGAGTGVGSLTVTVSSGTFSSSAYALKCGGGAIFLATTVSTSSITLQPGGRWRFTYNRFAAVDSTSPYTAYGVSKTPIGRSGTGSSGGGDFIELDGDGVLSLITGTPDAAAPHCVAVHANHLFVSQNNQLYHSAPGLPYEWTVITGAAQIHAGADVVELASVPGSEASQSLLVQAADATSVMYGTDALTWQMTQLSVEVGAKPLTTQSLGGMVALDQQGMRSVQPTQAFGNFAINTLTAHIRRQVLDLDPVGSAVDRVNGRYRLFLSDGRMLSGVPGKRWQWLWCRLLDAPFVVVSRELSGAPVTLFGGNDGFVYQMDVGRSFDGDAVLAWLKTSYASLGKPGVLKATRSFDVEVIGESAGDLSVQADYDYGDINTSTGRRSSEVITPSGSPWDVGQWDTGSWDSSYAALLRVRIAGVGENVSLTFLSESAIELSHRLASVVSRFMVRRPAR